MVMKKPYDFKERLRFFGYGLGLLFTLFWLYIIGLLFKGPLLLFEDYKWILWFEVGLLVICAGAEVWCIMDHRRLNQSSATAS